MKPEGQYPGLRNTNHFLCPSCFASQINYVRIPPTNDPEEIFPTACQRKFRTHAPALASERLNVGCIISFQSSGKQICLCLRASEGADSHPHWTCWGRGNVSPEKPFHSLATDPDSLSLSLWTQRSFVWTISSCLR